MPVTVVGGDAGQSLNDKITDCLANADELDIVLADMCAPSSCNVDLDVHDDDQITWIRAIPEIEIDDIYEVRLRRHICKADSSDPSEVRSGRFSPRLTSSLLPVCLQECNIVEAYVKKNGGVTAKVLKGSAWVDWD